METLRVLSRAWKAFLPACVLSVLAAPLHAQESKISPKSGSDDYPNIKGVSGSIIAHSPASSGVYLGTPSICALPDGTYVASHDFFGKNAPSPKLTAIYESRDKGRTWKKISEMNMFWGGLFYHNGALWMMGNFGGDCAIRKSVDGGKTWETSVIRQEELRTVNGKKSKVGFHTSSTAVLVANGRIWRAMERSGVWKHGELAVFSAPVDADLLKPESWTMSDPLFFPKDKKTAAHRTWLEGNMVADKSGKIWNMLRVHGITDDVAALVGVSEDGKNLSFELAPSKTKKRGFIRFPGGSKKFVPRYDEKSGKFWSLSNYIPPEYRGALPDNSLIRNTLALVYSDDLFDWKVARIILSAGDPALEAFQYADWIFDGDDIAFVSRTAYFDGKENARRQHDSNFITFHRIKNFRKFGETEKLGKDKGKDAAGGAGVLMEADKRGEDLDFSDVPGSVIAYSPAPTKRYIGTPSICILPDGTYIASHDFFGKGARVDGKDETHIYSSSDKGETWEKISEVEMFWGGLFYHNGALWLMGAPGGNCAILKSVDGGKTWTYPKDKKSGLIRGNAEDKIRWRGGMINNRFHTSSTAVVVAGGRIWRAMERARAGERGEIAVLSAPADSDLLDAENWRISTPFLFPQKLKSNAHVSWIEGNMVLDKNGQLWDMLRVLGNIDDVAALVKVSSDGTKLSFDSSMKLTNRTGGGFVWFPGGAKKFVVRYDPVSGRYWTLSNWIPEEYRCSLVVSDVIRNTLVLASSPDLFTWRVDSIVLQSGDSKYEGFQYADWLFDGDDIVFVSRTAYFDGVSKACNQHNSNFMTFHRIKNFRERTMKSPLLNARDVR